MDLFIIAYYTVLAEQISNHWVKCKVLDLSDSFTACFEQPKWHRHLVLPIGGKPASCERLKSPILSAFFLTNDTFPPHVVAWRPWVLICCVLV